MAKRLYRSRSNRMIWGVCGGLANYFDIDPVIVRIIAVLLAFAGGAGIPAYIVLAIVVPLEDSRVTEPKDIIKENVEEIKKTASQLGNEIRSALAREENAPAETVRRQHHSRTILGTVLIIIGILFLVASFDFLWWLRWTFLWPLIIIAIGVLIILSTRRR